MYEAMGRLDHGTRYSLGRNHCSNDLVCSACPQFFVWLCSLSLQELPRLIQKAVSRHSVHKRGPLTMTATNPTETRNGKANRNGRPSQRREVICKSYFRELLVLPRHVPRRDRLQANRRETLSLSTHYHRSSYYQYCTILKPSISSSATHLNGFSQSTNHTPGPSASADSTLHSLPATGGNTYTLAKPVRNAYIQFYPNPSRRP
jgi:hypothetical protein